MPAKKPETAPKTPAKKPRAKAASKATTKPAPKAAAKPKAKVAPKRKAAAKKPRPKRTSESQRRKHNSTEAVEAYNAEKRAEGLEFLQTVKTAGATGRPTVFNWDVANEICARISMGQTMTSICRDDHLPNKSTVFGWILFPEQFKNTPQEDLKVFIERYHFARTIQAEGFVDELPEIADDTSKDWQERETKNGDNFLVPDQEVVNRSKLKVSTRQWLASSLIPRIQAMKDKTISVNGGNDENGKPRPMVIKAYKGEGLNPEE